MSKPETDGGRPMPYAWLRGKTWYRGGALYVVFVKDDEAANFEREAAVSGFVVESRSPGLLPGTVKFALYETSTE